MVTVVYIKKYECGRCGQKFDTELEAINCERAHPFENPSAPIYPYVPYPVYPVYPWEPYVGC